MIDKITSIWLGNSVPEEIDPSLFKNKDMYELYKLVTRAYCIRREIENYRSQTASEKYRSIIIYEQAILAKLEYSIEKLLENMHR